MKLLAAMVTAFSLSFASQASFAQAGGPPAAVAPEAESLQSSQTIQIARGGSQPYAKGPGEHFTGSARIDPLFRDNLPSHTSGARVTFEPWARTAWHSHPLGQTLIVSAGTGWIQQWGGQVENIREGDVVWIPPNVKHWHGATASTSMTHIAIQEGLMERLRVDGKGERPTVWKFSIHIRRSYRHD